MKIIRYFCEAVIIYIFFIISKFIGLKLSRSVFSVIFKRIGPIIRSNNLVNKNLSRFSKSITENEKKEIMSNMWKNYGMTFIEYIFLKKFRDGSKHIKIDGEIILEKIAKSNKPVIFVSGHFANFELMSMEITKKKIKLATIYRPLNNFFLNPLMEYLRKKYICKNQIQKGRLGVKNCINFIKDHHSIALMIDQRVSEGEQIEFFNDKALTTTLPAQLSIKFGLDIVPVFIERKNGGFFKMKVFEPIKNEKVNNKMNITKKLNKILEKMIIKNPNQWIWTHDRWK